MIECLRFGAGFRADGPDWGQLASPYLQDSWRPLTPGIHNFETGTLESAVVHQLTVLSDGRGRLSATISPIWLEMSRQAAPNSLYSLAMPTGRLVVPIDESRRVLPVMNVYHSDALQYRKLGGGNPYRLLRLTGMVRYS